MHIVYLTPGFPINEHDSACIPAIQCFIKNISQEKIKVSVITFQYPEEELIYTWNNLKVYSCGGKNSKLSKIATWYRAIGFFKEINRLNKVDLIHSFWLGETYLIGKLLSLLYSIPCLVTLMGQDVLSSNKYLKLFRNKKNIYIGLSGFQEQELYKTTGRRFTKIIPWGFDENHFQVDNNYSREIDVIGIGSLNDIKNYDEFIEVIDLVKKEKPDIKCAIVGGGAQRDYIQKKISELSLNSNIHLTGLLRREETFKLLQKSKILLHTSKFESFGMVYVEALWSGTKIVSYKRGIADENITKLCFDKSDMRDAILKILMNESNYEIKKLFPINDSVLAYKDLYYCLIS